MTHVLLRQGVYISLKPCFFYRQPARGKIHHADAVSSSAGALQIVKLYVQIKMWLVQDKTKDGQLQHRLISVSWWKFDQRCPLKVPESMSVTVSLGSLFHSLIVHG